MSLSFRLSLLILAILLWPVAAKAERRVALVVGNGTYQHSPVLRNPTKDAAAVANVLRKLDFEVLVGTDLTKIQLEETLKRFIRSLSQADVALFYFSGHAFQVDDQNYLVPTSARFDSLADITLQTMALEWILDAMKANAKTHLIFLDACRNNPFVERIKAVTGSNSAASLGLARVSPSVGSLVVFSTAPGTVALDGDGDLSPFSTAFVARAIEPKLEIRQAVTKIRRDVVAATDGKQIPWDNSSLLTDFYLVRQKQPPVLEELAFVSVRRSDQTSAVPLKLSPPRQPEGGDVRIVLAAVPRFGTLNLGDRPLAAGDRLSPLEFASLAYRGTRAGAASDAFSFRVDDDWGNEATGFVNLAIEAEPQRTAGSLPRRDTTQDRVELGEVRTAAISTLGLGPNLRLISFEPRTFERDAGRTWLRLSNPLSGGQLFIDERPLDQGRAVRLSDLPKLAFLPAVGMEGRTAELVFSAEEPVSGQLKLQIRVEMDACDRFAGARFDLQGVAEGVLPNQIDVAKARPACETAVRDRPEIGRFHFQLGRVYLAEARNREALQAFERAAALGHMRARGAIGGFYDLGTFVPHDPARAKAEYEVVAATGDVYGMHALGQLYYEGRGVQRDVVKARKLFEKAARVGHTYSMNSLGRIYDLGEGVTRDPSLARQYWEASAERGDLYGIYNLGFVYLNGIGAEANTARALAYFKQAAEHGHPLAPNLIGRFYVNGLGVPVDLVEARKWYQLGSDRGDAWAALNLGLMHQSGAGTKVDIVAAAKAFARAAAFHQLEPSGEARTHLAGIGEAAKLEALKQLVTKLDPGANISLPRAALLRTAATLAAKRGAKPDSDGFDDILVAAAKAEWLASGVRLDNL